MKIFYLTAKKCSGVGQYNKQIFYYEDIDEDIAWRRISCGRGWARQVWNSTIILKYRFKVTQ